MRTWRVETCDYVATEVPRRSRATFRGSSERGAADNGTFLHPLNNDESHTCTSCSTVRRFARDPPPGGAFIPGPPTGTAPDLHVEIHLGSHRRRYCHARIDFSRKDLGLSLKCDLQTKLGSQRPRRRPNKYEIRADGACCCCGFHVSGRTFQFKIPLCRTAQIMAAR
jgi:hypothetical protein